MSNDPSALVILDFSDRAKRWLRKMKKRDGAVFEQIRRKKKNRKTRTPARTSSRV